SPVTMTFANVTSTGTTSVTTLPTNAFPPPDGYAYLNNGTLTSYDVSTTATYTGSVQVCFTYAGGGHPLLYHGNGHGGWTNITTGYPSPGVVCGSTTSLSPFALMMALPATVTPVVSGTLGTNGWYVSDVSLSWTVTPSFADATGCGDASVTANTAGQTFTCSASTDGGSDQ